MKEIFKKNKGILISTLITIIIILTIFFSKGIYPFGENIFGLIDFDHAYTPVYYKLWDILHGNGTALFDWNLGSGLNSFGSLIMNSLILPSSLIIGIFPRDMIPQAMSYILVLKLVEMSIFTYISLDKLFKKLDYKYKIAFTLLYTYSGWTIINISNLLYLDVVALFPLFVLSYYRLLKENKWVMYLFILTLCLLLNYYMSWMILFFIIGTTIISLIFLDIKEKRNKAVLVTLLTLGSLGISCCLFLPSFYQSITSARMNNESYEHYYSMGVFFLKIIALFPLAIPLFLNSKQLLKKESRKINLFFIILMIYLLIGVVIEPINLWWHTGSYNGFPFRYSYIPSFIIICFSMFYLNNEEEKAKKNTNVLNIVGFSVLTAILIFLSYYFYDELSTTNIVYEIEKYSQFFGLLMLFIINMGISFIVFKNNKKLSSILCIIIISINALIYGLIFINKGMQSSLVTQNILDNFELKQDVHNYSDYTYDLNYNFPYILNVPSMENRIHLIKEEAYNLQQGLGYNYYDSIMLSKGGTLFSNLLLNNKYILTKRTLNEELYTLLDEKDNFYYYEAKYNLNYIIPYSGNIYNIDNGDFIENQNNLYKKLFNKDENLIKNIESTEKYKFISGNIYYLYVTCMDDYYCNNFDLLKNVHVEQATVLNPGGYNYYVEFYVDEETEMQMDKEYFETVKAAYINIDEYKKFAQSITNYSVDVVTNNNKRIIKYSSLEDKSILIPISYDEALKIYINGEEVKYKLNVYNMISVDLKKGDNEIKIVYTPKFLKEGLIISIVSILSITVLYLLNKKVHFLNNPILLNVLFITTCIIAILFILKIYVLSIF